MIFTVMLAEDEPMALRHLRSTIEKRCPGFRVIASAEDGVEAYEKLSDYHPDLLITDIRMPRLNGLELVEKVKKHFPEIQTIILSGYQEFDYARQALQHDVIQYLLKPINIPEFETLMANTYNSLCQKSYWTTYKLIQQYLSDKECGVLNHFEGEWFRIAVLRVNGLHPKFHKKVSYNPPKAIWKLLTEQLTTEECMNIFLFTGRDDNEFYILCPEEKIHYCRFKTIIEDFSRKIPFCRYYTAALSIRFSLIKFTEVLGNLYSLLREKTILGNSQILYEINDNTHSDQKLRLSSVFIRNVECLMKTKALKQIRESLSEWLGECRIQKIPLIQIEMEFNQFVLQMISYCSDDNQLRIETGIMIDQVSRDVGDFKTLLDNFMEIISYIQSYIQQAPPVTGSEESFKRIKDYIEQHMAEDLSVTVLCGKFFISHSYLNKLFHKFEDMTVIEYIRQQRVNVSINIMKKSPQIPLKDISRMIGYEDSSYFSRVFKSQKGCSPRMYLELKE